MNRRTLALRTSLLISSAAQAENPDTMIVQGYLVYGTADLQISANDASYAFRCDQ